MRLAASAFAVLVLACSSGEQSPRAKALAAASTKTEAPRATTKMEGTALAASGDTAARLLGLSDDAESASGDFRSGVVEAMTQALGRAPVTRQDALNATYLAVGWQRGTKPTDRQSRDAYHQACRWGFTLGEFNELGRSGGFRSEDLASAPLDEHAHRAFTKGWSPEHAERQQTRALASLKAAAPHAPPEVKEQPVVRALAMSDVPAVSDAPAVADVPEISGDPSSHIAHLMVRLEQLAATSRKLEGEIAQLEASAREPNVDPGRLKRLTRKVESLRDLVRFTEASTQRLEKELEAARNKY